MLSQLHSCEQDLCVKLVPIILSGNMLPTESRDVWSVLLCFVFQLATNTQVGDSLLMLHHDIGKLPSTCKTLLLIKLPRLSGADCDSTDRSLNTFFRHGLLYMVVKT